MSRSSCTVLIAAPDLLPALKQHADTSDEIITFSDTDALRALEVITKRRPKVVALERVFAGTARGAALINRIRADPSLTDSEIRVISHEGEPSRAPSRKGGSGEDDHGGRGHAHKPAPAAAVAAPAVQPLDQRGTRRAPRFKVAAQVEIVVDGNTATLIDLSTIGAQVVSPAVLKPNQRVRLALNDEQGSLRFNASVAWASFEIPAKSGPRYRAGLEFVDADGMAVDAFCDRHKAS